MNFEILIYPLVAAIPGIVWFFIQFKKHQETEIKDGNKWQIIKLILSIVVMIAVAGLASFMIVASMLGHGAQTGEVLKLFGGAVLMYVATIFLLGQWILSTRLGNVSIAIVFGSGFFYLVVLNPVLFVRPLAEKNIVTAQYVLGYFFEAGIGGVPKSKQYAGQWYSKAGLQGHISAARAYVSLFPSSGNTALLKILAADDPDGDIYYALYMSTFKSRHLPETELKKDRDKWLNLAADYGHRDAILKVMNKHYSLESSCRLSPQSYEALPKFEKWLSAYENNRGKPSFKEYLLEELQEKVTCLAEKVAKAKQQDAQLANFKQDLFSSDSQTRSNAQYTLGQMGARAIGAIPELLKLAHSRDNATAWNALETIKKIDPGGELVTEEIMTMLTLQAPHERINGAYGVALYADVLPNAVTLLDKLLGDPDNDVAGRAALALAEYGELANGSLKKIAALQKSRDGRLSSYARQAYNKIMNGKKPGNNKQHNYTVRF